MPLIQVTLTPAESKRLIAKAVAALPEVKRALSAGTVIIGLGTTNACVVEEILKKKIDRSKYVAGVVLPGGTSVLPREKRLPEVIIQKGKVVGKELDEVLDSLGPDDVVIKGANAIDAGGTAGVLLASPKGGTVGKVMGYVKARGVNLIIPVGLEKLVPGSISEVSKKVGIQKFEHAIGEPVGLMPISGKVVTEIEAIKILSGANAEVMAKGGVSGAEGSITLALSGTAGHVSRAKKIVRAVKGEPPLKIDV